MASKKSRVSVTTNTPKGMRKDVWLTAQDLLNKPLGKELKAILNRPPLVKDEKPSKPPLVSVEGHELQVGVTVYLVDRNSGYSEIEHPRVGKIVEMDLTNRTARVQLKGPQGGEVRYFADLAQQEKYPARRLFTTAKGAGAVTLEFFKDRLDRAEKAYHKAAAELREQQAKYDAAKNWKPKGG